MKAGNGGATHGMTIEEKRYYREGMYFMKGGRDKKTASFATIPPELSTAVADYAEAILGVKNERI
jgi:hypothetical protein